MGMPRVTGGRYDVPRRRLLERILITPHCVLIEAGGGFGKSVLIDQLSATAGGLRLRLPRRFPVDVGELKARLLETATGGRVDAGPRVSVDADVGPADLVPRGEHRVLAVDNANSLTADAAAWLADLAQEDSSALRVVMSARRLPEPLAALEFRGAALRLDTDDLRLTLDEARALLDVELGQRDSERLATPLHRFSGGWAALLLLVVRRLVRADDRAAAAANVLRQPALVGTMVDTYQRDLAAADQTILVQLAHLPVLSESIADALGSPGLLHRVSQAGIPVTLGPDGWWRLPGVVRETLVARAPLDPEVARQAAPLLTAGGVALVAAEVLADTDQAQVAVDLLAELPADRVGVLDPTRFIRLVGNLGGLVDLPPRLLLHLANVHATVGQLAEQTKVLDRALQAVQAEPGAHAGVAVEVEAEWLFHQAVLNNGVSPARIEQMLDEAEADSHTQARLLVALGVVLSESTDDASLGRAEAAMRQAVIVWRKLGDDSSAAYAQRGLAIRVLTSLGRTDEGATLLARLGDASNIPMDRMRCLVFRAMLLALSGDGEAADAALGEAVPLAEVLGIDWVVGYAAWVRMLVAASRHDKTRVLAELAVAESNLGQIAASAGGLIFVCDAADACALVGARSHARRLLATAQSRRQEDPVSVGLAEAYLAARLCQPGAANGLERLQRQNAVPPGQRWKVELLRGYAEYVAGDEAAARLSFQEALDSAARLGHPDLPEQREGRVVELLRSILVIPSDPSGPSSGSGPGEFQLRLLGAFELRRERMLVPVPSGHVASLMKYVALAGGRVSVEMVVEALWPEEAAGVGQRRLKNVLSRSRFACGPLIVRVGRQLRLTGCEVDLTSFEHAANAVAAAGGDERVVAAREALDRFTGELLPDDLYDDWIAQRREKVRRRVLGLVDIVLASEIAAQRLDDAVELLQLATGLDPYDQERPLRVARALDAAGRRVEVRALAIEAAHALDELGIQPAVEWRELVPH